MAVLGIEKQQNQQHSSSRIGGCGVFGRDIWRFIDAVDVPDEDLIISSWTTMEKPVLSVFLNTYNHVDFIEDAIIGILIQKTNFPFEILIHDDASSDGTREKIERISTLYPKLIKPIFQQENQFSKGNPPWVFQAPRSKGDFVAFCEGDDFWTDPEKLQKQVDLLRNREDIVVTGHDAVILAASGSIQAGTRLGGRGKNLSPAKLRRHSLILPLSMCYRNITLPDAPERRRVLNGDTFLFSLLGHYGGYFHHSDIQHGVYRTHNGGVWSSLDLREKLEERKNTFFWMAAFYGRTNNKEMFEFFQNRYLQTCWALGEVGGRTGFVAMRFQRVLGTSRQFLRFLKAKVVSRCSVPAFGGSD